jgi:LPPG:FO 2-phospho-L-lactate transferase
VSGHILALAGGVGGAKLVLGLSRVLLPDALTVVVNTGDDDEFHGLHVSPDLDTVVYTLAGLANPATGWGLEGETFQVLEGLHRLGADTWFNLGDRDLATHIRRTELLALGHSLSEVTAEICHHLGVSYRVAPMTDAKVRTVVQTSEGVMPFQEYFVRRGSQPEVTAIKYAGVEEARPSPALEAALGKATAVVICPSNPFLSVEPILSLPGVRDRLGTGGRPVAVVTPIIAGKAVKGPLDRLFASLTGVSASGVAVARYYEGLGTHFVLDAQDAASAGEIAPLGYTVAVEDTLMRDDGDKVRLATAVCRLVSLTL